MSIVLFTVAGSPPLIGRMIKEDKSDEYVTIEHPLALMKETPNLYAFQYMPFAKEGLVKFKLSNFISVASVDDELAKYYSEMVERYKSQKIVYKEEEEPMPLPRNISKSFH